MAQAGTRVARRALDIFSEPAAGVPGAFAALTEREGISADPLTGECIRMSNAAPEVIEKLPGANYPAIHVYCEKLHNQLREKFRTFSGKARLAAEIRVTQDRLDGIEQKTQTIADAITDVLDARRGDWGEGMVYGGGYEVAFGPVKLGGKHYLQIAKVTFEVDISFG